MTKTTRLSNRANLLACTFITLATAPAFSQNVVIDGSGSQDLSQTNAGLTLSSGETITIETDTELDTSGNGNGVQAL